MAASRRSTCSSPNAHPLDPAKEILDPERDGQRRRGNRSECPTTVRNSNSANALADVCFTDLADVGEHLTGPIGAMSGHSVALNRLLEDQLPQRVHIPAACATLCGTADKTGGPGSGEGRGHVEYGYDRSGSANPRPHFATTTSISVSFQG